VADQAVLSLWQLCLVDDRIKAAAAGEGAIGLMMELLRTSELRSTKEAAACTLAVVLPYLLRRHRVAIQLTAPAAASLLDVVGDGHTTGQQVSSRRLRGF
jgi:hypothetical protein